MKTAPYAFLMIAAFGCAPTAGLAQAEPPSSTTSPKPRPPAASPAQPAGRPDMTTETYGDWVMRCSQADGSERCDVSQTIIMQGQTSPIALISLRRENKEQPLRIIVQLPTNITFASGVKTLFADGSAIADLGFRRCFPTGCFADAVLDDQMLAKIRTQSEPGSLKFRDGTDSEVSLPLSLKGLGSALDALARSER